MMRKVLSKLMKNEKNTVIPLHLVYLSKSHENILKCYRLNLYQEITIGFTCCLQITMKSHENFSNGFFI